MKSHDVVNFRLVRRDHVRLAATAEYERDKTGRSTTMSDLAREAVRVYLHGREEEDPDLAAHNADSVEVDRVERAKA